MSISAPARSDAEDGNSQAASVQSNRHQMWYQKLCREDFQRALTEDPNESFPSPQRLQLQLHFQREYQQRQELQKNCRQEWWQRKSGLGPPSPSPYTYRSPSPGAKLYAGAPVYYQEQSQPPSSSSLPPRTLPPRPAPRGSYYQPASGRVESVSAECRRRIEHDLIDREREKMIKAAQVIKHDAEKRIRQAKRDLAAPPNDQGNIQRLLLQLLKEQDLAQKLKASSQVPPTPTPMSNLSVDLQYKLATLLQAYQPLQSQQVSAGYQRRWQEQIGTYKDMLQEYRHGNFFQSHQKAKRLLQLLLQPDPPSSSQGRPPPGCYPPEGQAVYQQYPSHEGGAPQSYFRPPLPPQPNRPRRDPRLNRSSQQYYNRGNDITPRLNQSSYQYSEQDITPEIIYQADISRKSGTVRRNSTPRKQCEEQAGQEVSAVTSAAAGGVKQQQHVTYADDRDREVRKAGEAQTDSDTTLNRTSVASDEQEESDSRSECVQDWEQLQQRSRCHRRGHRYRPPSQDRAASVTAGKGEQRNGVNPGPREDRALYANHTRHEGDIRIVVNGDHRKAYPVKDSAESLQSQHRARAGTGPRGKEHWNQHTSDNHAEGMDKGECHQTNTQNDYQFSLSNGELVDKTENVSRVTEKNPALGAMNGVSDAEESHGEPEDRCGDPQTGGKSRVQFSSVHNGGCGHLDIMAGNDDDGKSAEVAENGERGRQEKEDSLALKQNGKDRRETRGVTGQASHSSQGSEPQQPRTKQQPPAQSRQTAQSRGQTARHPHPQQTHRGSRQPPPPRSSRQSPGSQQLSGHQTANSRPPSQLAHKSSESRSVQTESRTSAKGAKSSVPLPPENATEKGEGTKSPGSSVSKQGGKKSPGNTYVIRNSGQKLSTKAPAGAQREKAGSTKSQGSNTHSASLSSPGSNESKSPSDFPSKAQGSPSERSRRRRYRRKPWEREEAGPYKTARSNSAPRSHGRFGEQGGEGGGSDRWLSPSQRWMGRNSNWEPQPRRRRYQWEDAKTGPARKWKAYGQEGRGLPGRVSSSVKDVREAEAEQPATASSSLQVKPTPEAVDSSTSCDLENNSEDMDECSFTTQPEMSPDKERAVFEETPGKERQDEEEGQPEEEGDEDTAEHRHEQRSLKIVPNSSNRSETGVSEDPAMNSQNDSGNEKEDGVDKEKKAAEHEMYTQDPVMQTAIDAEQQKTLQQQAASQGSMSGAPETEVHASGETQTELACGKGAAESRPTPASGEEETASDSGSGAREAGQSPSQVQSLEMGQPETSLEHVLAVLGKKAAQTAEEWEEEDGEHEQQVAASEQAAKGGVEAAAEAEVRTSRVPGAAAGENVTAPRAAGGASVSTADGSCQTDSPQHLPARIVRLEEMEDWQALDVPSPDKGGHGESPGAGFRQRGDPDQTETVPCGEKEEGGTGENRAGSTQRLGEETGKVNEGQGQRDLKVTALEQSVQIDEPEIRHVSCKDVLESTPAGNAAPEACVEGRACQSGVTDRQGPSAGAEQTPGHLPGNGEVVGGSVPEVMEKQGEQAKEAPDTDGPESGQVQKAGERCEGSEDVPVSHSEPDTASGKSCLISTGESGDQETCDLTGPQSATADSQEDSSQPLLPGKSDHSTPRTADAEGCQETRTEDTDTRQLPVTEPQSSRTQGELQTTDGDGTVAPPDKAVSGDCSDRERKEAGEVQSQPHVPRCGERSQSPAVASAVELCTPEAAAGVISPLSALAHSAVCRFSDGQGLAAAVCHTPGVQPTCTGGSRRTGSSKDALSSAEGSSHATNGNTKDTPNDTTNDTPNGETSNVNAAEECRMATSPDVQQQATDGLQDGAVTDSTSRQTDGSSADLPDNHTDHRETETDGQGGTPTASDDVKKKSSPETDNAFCCEEHHDTSLSQTMVGLCSKCGRQTASENGKKSRLNLGDILHDKLTAFGYL